MIDYLLNGAGGLQGYGVGATLMDCRMDPCMLRPYVNNRGIPCVALRTKDGKAKEVPVANLQARGLNSPVLNAARLTRDAWIQIDRAVVEEARARLRAWTDLAASSQRGGFDAMSVMTMEYQTVDDVGEAVVDMDTLTDGRNDRPLVSVRSLPLPITHSDFYFSERELQVSRRSGMPLDTTMARMAGRRVAEMIEDTVIGTQAGIAYGTRSTGQYPHDGESKVYGYTNFPFRVTKTDLTVPTGNNPEAILSDVLEMVEVMISNGFYGPYMLYHSTAYSRYLADDYFRAGSTSAVRSVRERLMATGDITDIRRLDRLTDGFQLLMIQMGADVATAINGMDVTTVQWDSQGGMRHNLKVLAVQVPLLKATQSGVSGILHATAA